MKQHDFYLLLGRDKYRILPLRSIRPWLQSPATFITRTRVSDVFHHFECNFAKPSIFAIKCDRSSLFSNVWQSLTSSGGWTLCFDVVVHHVFPITPSVRTHPMYSMQNGYIIFTYFSFPVLQYCPQRRHAILNVHAQSRSTPTGTQYHNTQHGYRYSTLIGCQYRCKQYPLQ